MNGQSSGGADVAQSPGSVIKPWLSAGLITGLAVNAVLSFVLIVNLGRSEAAKKEIADMQASISLTRGELAKLQVELDRLTKQKETLALVVADWEQRVKEKASAQATVASLQAQKQQIESDIAQANKRLVEASRALASEEQRRSDLLTEIQKLTADAASLVKSNADIKAALAMAADAECRRAEAELAATNAAARLRQLQAEIASAEKRLAQNRQETDAQRQSRDDLVKEVAALRQQRETLMQELADLQKQLAPLKAQLTSIRKTEEILASLREHVAAAEARAKDAEQRKSEATAEITNLVARLAQVQREVAGWETRRDAAKVDLGKADAELSAARNLTLELSTKRLSLEREVARLTVEVEKLRNERQTLEKEIGRLEAQQPKTTSIGQP